MRFKGTKQEILAKVQGAIYNSNHLHMNLGDYNAQQGMNTVMNYISDQIRMHTDRVVYQAFEELINNIYTEEDFEKDMGLKKD